MAKATSQSNASAALLLDGNCGHMTGILSASASLFQRVTDHPLMQHIIMPIVHDGHGENRGIRCRLRLVAIGAGDFRLTYPFRSG